MGFAEGIAVGFTVGSFVVGTGYRFREFVCGGINEVNKARRKRVSGRML